MSSKQKICTLFAVSRQFSSVFFMIMIIEVLGFMKKKQKNWIKNVSSVNKYIIEINFKKNYVSKL